MCQERPGAARSANLLNSWNCRMFWEMAQLGPHMACGQQPQRARLRAYAFGFSLSTK